MKSLAFTWFLKQIPSLCFVYRFWVSRKNTFWAHFTEGNTYIFGVLLDFGQARGIPQVVQGFYRWFHFVPSLFNRYFIPWHNSIKIWDLAIWPCYRGRCLFSGVWQRWLIQHVPPKALTTGTVWLHRAMLAMVYTVLTGVSEKRQMYGMDASLFLVIYVKPPWVYVDLDFLSP